MVPAALTALFLVAPLGADTCLAPKKPVPAAVVCGHVFDPSGGLVADVELQLVSNESVVAEVHADAKGNFMFAPVPKGEYNLTTKSQGWHIFWPVKVTSSKASKTCKQPLEVTLSLKTCGAGVSKKGYHTKFGN
jgi:Carboxypeptidase regulatory-like domain